LTVFVDKVVPFRRDDDCQGMAVLPGTRAREMNARECIPRPVEECTTGAVRNCCRWKERRTGHRHSRPVSGPRRVRHHEGDGRVRPKVGTAPDGEEDLSADGTVGDATGVGRPVSADPDRGAAGRTDSTERSRFGEHHGQAPSRSRADAVIAAREHYPHRYSPRNPFLEIRPELHSRTVRRRRTHRTPRSHEWYRGVRRGRGA
jgi:hypothetical protein